MKKPHNAYDLLTPEIVQLARDIVHKDSNRINIFHGLRSTGKTILGKLFGYLSPTLLYYYCIDLRGIIDKKKTLKNYDLIVVDINNGPDGDELIEYYHELISIKTPIILVTNKIPPIQLLKKHNVFTHELKIQFINIEDDEIAPNQKQRLSFSDVFNSKAIVLLQNLIKYDTRLDDDQHIDPIKDINTGDNNKNFIAPLPLVNYEIEI